MAPAAIQDEESRPVREAPWRAATEKEPGSGPRNASTLARDRAMSMPPGSTVSTVSEESLWPNSE